MHRVPVGLTQLIALGLLEVGFDHGFHQFREADARFPTQHGLGLGRVAEQELDLGGAKVAGIDAHPHLPGVGIPTDFIHAGATPLDGIAQFPEGPFNEFTHGVSFAGGDDVVVGDVLLQHPPHRAHVILGVAPVAFRVEVAQIQGLLQAQVDVGDGAGDLAGDEGFATNRRFVVEQDAVAGMHPVGFAVVDGDPVAIDLGGGVRAARVEGRGFLLGNFLDLAEHFAGGGLVEAGFAL